MPSTYAHYKLGISVLDAIDSEYKKIIESHRQLFMIGLHGPDILFFYKPLRKNQVNRLGHAIHDKAGRVFFEEAARIIKIHPNEPEYLSYLYGVVCHFALDVSCHGYVGEKIQSSGASHTEIETEFDRSLIVADGLDPLRFMPTGHLVPSDDNSEVIEEFYPGVNSTQIRKGIKGLVNISNFFVTPSNPKRRAIYTAMKIAGAYQGVGGLVVNENPNPLCADSNQELTKRLIKAKPLALALIANLDNHIRSGEDLDKMFNFNFSSKLV